MWARQGIGDADVDYERWGRARVSLMQMAALSRSSIFAVDVYKGVYDYASDGFADLFGIQPALLRNISEQGDMIEDLIHPDDSEKIADLQHALRRRHPRHAPADTDSPG
jgi:hypothetical protein